MLKNTFDPLPDQAYGSCVTCGLALATEQAAKDHRTETMPVALGGNSHTTSATNPTRRERIQTWVSRIVEEAVEGAIDEIEAATDAEAATAREIAAALSRHSEFGDAWEARA